MSSDSTIFSNLSDIRHIVNQAEIYSRKKQTFNEARKLYLLSSFAEAKEGVVLLGRTIIMIPPAFLKLVPSTCYFLLTLLSKENGEVGNLEQGLKYVHETKLGITTLFFTAFKAAYCFSNIILSPLFGFIDPHFNTRCHKTLLEIEQKKIVEPVEDKKIYFENLIGLCDVKDRINKSVLNILKNPKRATLLGLKIQNILLHGLPGCGKTYLVESLVNSIQKVMGKVKYYKIDTSTIASPYVHGAGIKINNLFDQIQKEINQGFFPILFMDEIDGLLSKRTENSLDQTGKAHNQDVNLFLQKIEAISGKALVIGATNRPFDLDSAFLRHGRIGKHIFVSPPSQEERKNLIESYLKKYNQNILDETINIDLISQKTENYSTADLLGLFEDFAAELLSLELENKHKSQQEILDELLAARKPSCSPGQVLEYKIRNRNFFPEFKNLVPSF